MNVLLVFPRPKIITGDPPLGIAYVASYLRERIPGINIKILDTTFNNNSKFIIKNIKETKPDIMGIYTSSLMMNNAFRIANIAKNEFDIPLVAFGGPHASILPKDTLNHKSVDAITIGEGEYSFSKIVENFGKRNDINDLKGIPNVHFKYNGKIIRNEKRYFIQNLDSIPFPARDLLYMEKYIKNWFQMDSVSSMLRGTSIFTTRYCPYNCTFCQPTTKLMFGNFIRRRSPENIIEELKHLKKRYKINAFQIYDDIFMINEKYLNDFCDKMLKEDLDLVWMCHQKSDVFFKSDLLKKMYRGGLRLVGIGIESGSQRILDDIYKKGIDLTQTKKVISKLKKSGIKIRGYFIIGAPTESVQEIQKSISFATTSELDEAVFSILCPLPGTYLFDMIKSKGWEIIDIEDMELEHYYSSTAFISGTLPSKILKKYQRVAMIKFYFDPSRIGYLVNSFRNPRKAFNKIKTYFL